MLSVGFVGRSLGAQLDAAGAGALEVHHGDRIDTIGSDDVIATLHTDDFELLRALTGRRSLEQIAAYHWDGRFPTEHLVLARFTARLDPLVE